MGNKKDKNPATDIENINEEIKGSDADTDRGITEGRFAKIGQKQAGENNLEEEIKGSDADRSV